MQDEMTLFSERQHFRQGWLWALLLGTGIPVIIFVGLLCLKDGREALPAFLIVVGVEAAAIALIWFARLDIAVTPREIVAKFTPFHLSQRRIPLTDIVEAKRRQYDPILDYGGWGIRYSSHGWAWNVSGDEGVQLVLASGKRILIGSQKPAELEAAITSALLLVHVRD